MHIDVWADFACPWSYLGIHHLRDALTRFEHRDQVEVRFHAYLLDPEQSSVLEMSQAEFLVHTHPGMSLDEADEALERVSELSRADGISLDFESLVLAPTSFAHKAMAAAREMDERSGITAGAATYQFTYAEALFRARFEVGLNLADPDVLIGCAQDVRIPEMLVVDALSDPVASSEVFSDYQIAIQMGIDSIPTYLFDRRFVVQGLQSLDATVRILESAWSQSLSFTNTTEETH